MNENHFEFAYLLEDYFKLDFYKSDHGINHWERVRILGEHLAKVTGADPDVVYYFAYCHDIKRENEGTDPKHGLRAAEFVNGFFIPYPEDADLNKKQIEQLKYACGFHCQSGAKSDDITIQTCWDADRLDLWRVGVVPDPYFLNTEEAKQKETIEFAKNLYEKWEYILND